MMTRQEMLDRVAQNLMPQGVRCVAPMLGGSLLLRLLGAMLGGSLTCVYLKPETGHRCAAGWCIPDEILCRLEDDNNNLGTAIIDLFEAYGPDALGWDPNDEHFLSELQFIHDEIDPDQWDEEYRSLAQGYGLKWRPAA